MIDCPYCARIHLRLCRSLGQKLPGELAKVLIQANCIAWRVLVCSDKDALAETNGALQRSLSRHPGQVFNVANDSNSLRAQLGWAPYIVVFERPRVVDVLAVEARLVESLRELPRTILDRAVPVVIQACGHVNPGDDDVQLANLVEAVAVRWSCVPVWEQSSLGHSRIDELLVLCSLPVNASRHGKVIQFEDQLPHTCSAAARVSRHHRFLETTYARFPKMESSDFLEMLLCSGKVKP